MSNIKSFIDSASGKELKDLLLKNYLELKNVDNIKECESATAQAIEIKSTKKAAEKLGKILEGIMTIENYDSNKQAKDQYYSI